MADQVTTSEETSMATIAVAISLCVIGLAILVVWLVVLPIIGLLHVVGLV